MYARKYAVRADYEKRFYEVYDIEMGTRVARYRYRARSELSRGEAHGRANLHRDYLNRDAGFVYDESRMFPFASSRHTTTD